MLHPLLFRQTIVTEYVACFPNKRKIILTKMFFLLINNSFEQECKHSPEIYCHIKIKIFDEPIGSLALIFKDEIKKE